MPEMDFYFDYRSPYAYLAHLQLRKLGADIAHRPFDIRAVMEKVGNVPTSVTCKAKNRYIQADLARWVQHYGVPFKRHPRMLELDFGRLLRATLLASDRGPVGDLVTALFDALWAVTEPLETPFDVARIMRRVGIEALSPEQDIDHPLWEATLERSTTKAAERGVFGAPCMFIGHDMFFGNDRLDFVRARLEQAA